MLSPTVGNQFKKGWLSMPKRLVAYQQLEPVTSVVVDTNTTYTHHPQMEEVRVDMAGMKVESRPVELVTSVGSCIGNLPV